MAGFPKNHGVIVGLVIALQVTATLMAPKALAEPGHDLGSERPEDVASTIAGSSKDEISTVKQSSRREELDACDQTNPIRMATDGVNELAHDDVVSGGRPEKKHDAVLPQPETAEIKPADMAMPRSDLAATAPADGPSPSGSTRLTVSLLVRVGMALMGLVVGLLVA